jgi:peptidoglycan/xylan/chitin deacetylase (PgdA/CDA1 family)
MSTAPELCWIYDQPVHRAAIEYTVRLLSTLIGVRAVPIPIAEAPADIQRPTVWYARQPGPEQPSVLWVRPDLRFWDKVTNRNRVSPLCGVKWEDTILPTWAELAGPPDPIAATFFLVSRIEESTGGQRDSHDRFPASRAWMVRAGLIERLLVHEYAAAIARLLGLANEAPPRLWPDGKRFAIAFTHDIDRMRMHGPLWQEVRSTLGGLRFRGGWGAAKRRWQSRRAVRAGKARDPYDKIDQLTALHEKYGYHATFFWINSLPSMRDGDYTWADENIRSLAKSLQERGFENGLHGSYHSYKDAVMLAAQRSSLEKATETPVTAVRQHYLRLSVPETWQAQRHAGLSTDSTLGFAECLGFRAGIAVPFHPWSFEQNQPLSIWELPLVMMDGTLREYMRLSPTEAIARSRAIIERFAAVGGAASLLWHNSSLDNIDWHGWEPVYESWLAATAELAGWGGTVSEVVNAWEQHGRLLGNW